MHRQHNTPRPNYSTLSAMFFKMGRGVQRVSRQFGEFWQHVEGAKPPKDRKRTGTRLSPGSLGNPTHPCSSANCRDMCTHSLKQIDAKYKPFQLKTQLCVCVTLGVELSVRAEGCDCHPPRQNPRSTAAVDLGISKNHMVNQNSVVYLQ